ncbi:MAG: hypothetical protein NTX61_12700 [Bacteroidetes bacterium]|nr:hypothetical protein [Bacteroidota bacterium]
MGIKIKILLAIILIGIIAAILIYKFVIYRPQPNFENLKPDYSMNASDLYNAFKKDKVVSESKYAGKMVEISGSLTRVEASDTLSVAVFGFAQGMFGDEGVRCTVLPKFRMEVKKLIPGGTLKIKGYCEGFNDTDVIMEHCSLEANTIKN